MSIFLGAYIVACKWLHVPESKYRRHEFVCSAIFSEYIKQRWGCKYSIRPFKLTYHIIRQAPQFLWSCTVKHHKKRWSRKCCNSWLTCRKIHKYAGPGYAVNRRKLLPKVGTPPWVRESYFSALSIHSLLGELNYIRSNLVSHLFSSAGEEAYLHVAAIEV